MRQVKAGASVLAALAALSVGVAGASLASCGGVRLSEGDGQAPPASSVVRGKSCIGGSAQRSTPPHNEMPRNGITAEALAASRPLLDYLGSNSLAQASFEPPALPVPVAKALSGESTRTLFEYIVSCALDACQAIGAKWYRDDGAEQGAIVHGELGLCAHEASPYGDWSAGPPTQACKEVVSSCVLSRVNAHGRRVVISARDPRGALKLLDRVPVETSFREREQRTRPVSFTLCDGREGAPPDCGWEAQYVGKCTPDTVFKLSPPPGVAEVRVCKGVYGCDAAPGAVHPPYAGLADRSSGSPDEFRCPSDEASRGYFGVMVKRAPGTPAGADLTVTASCAEGTECKYPATESEVFPFEEGGFYGDLFAPGSPTVVSIDTAIPGCPREVVRDMLSGSMYACASPVWSDGVAHLTDRLCAGPTSPCFQNPPGPCWGPAIACSAGQFTNCHSGGCESTPPGAPQPIERDCEGTNASLSTWANTITVYLNHRCDLSRDLDSCRAALGLDAEL
ncbi:MAG TPA: hypothetical protein VFS43_00555 [Polyangiaceae bacterium]|nr:hypothetical protein [Polyangiaceae bacterium]